MHPFDPLWQLGAQQANMANWGQPYGNCLAGQAALGSYISDAMRNAIPQDFTHVLRGPMSELVLENLADRNAARVAVLRAGHHSARRKE